MASQPGRAGAKTKKAEIADDLRTRINSGRLGPGDQLPSEHELCAEHDVSRPTVREALKILLNEGLIDSVPTLGYFVRSPLNITLDQVAPEGAAPIAADLWHAALEEAGLVGEQHIRVEVLPYDREVSGRPLSGWLSIGLSGLVAVRRRTRYAARPGEKLRPQELSDLYCVYEAAHETPFMNGSEMPGSDDNLLTALGHPHRGFEDLLTPRMPSPAEAEELQLPGGTPVLEVLRTGFYGPERAALMLRRSVYVPGNTLRYRLTE